MSVKEKLKIVLITGMSDNWTSDLVTRFKDIHEVEFDNVIYCKKKGGTITRIKRNIKKHGIVYILWRLAKCFNSIVLEKLNFLVDRILLYPKVEGNLFSVCSVLGINLHEIYDIHSNEGTELLKFLNCDLLVVCGTGILKECVFDLPKLGTINLHQGEVPKYRGAPPGFWELWNNEEQVGVTVHFVDKGVDTGDIILQKILPIFEYDNLSTIMSKLSEISLSLYPAAVRCIATGKYRRVTQLTCEGKQFYLPTLAQRAQLNTRIILRQLNVCIVLKNIIKKMIILVILLAVYVRELFVFRKGKNILSVLCYHRVTDICQDRITTGVGEFEKQIRFLKKHYHIIAPSELHNWLSNSRKIKGKKGLLITFDDGYEDNYNNVLPILKKYSCPAIFFIPIASVGKDKQVVFEEEHRPELNFKRMNWTQIKDTMLYDIEIGIYIDTRCKISKFACRDSVQQIESEVKEYMNNLDRPPFFMSYSSDEKNEIALELINYVKKHQTITTLFSACGDKNICPIDNYNINRINIGSKDNDLLAFWYKTAGKLRTLLKPCES